jgi:hypothetical protein
VRCATRGACDGLGTPNPIGPKEDRAELLLLRTEELDLGLALFVELLDDDLVNHATQRRKLGSRILKAMLGDQVPAPQRRKGSVEQPYGHVCTAAR